MADPKRPRRSGEKSKRQVVQPCDNGKSAGDIGHECDLSHSTAHHWAKAIREGGSTRAEDNRTPERTGSSSSCIA